MKVRDVSQVGPPQPGKAPGEASAPKEDRVTLEKTKELTQAISRAQISAGSSRSAHLAALEAAVRSGTYRPSPHQIADKILEAAVVDARLRALLEQP